MDFWEDLLSISRHSTHKRYGALGIELPSLCCATHAVQVPDEQVVTADYV